MGYHEHIARPAVRPEYDFAAAGRQLLAGGELTAAGELYEAAHELVRQHKPESLVRDTMEHDTALNGAESRVLAGLAMREIVTDAIHPYDAGQADQPALREFDDFVGR